MKIKPRATALLTSAALGMLSPARAQSQYPNLPSETPAKFTPLWM